MAAGETLLVITDAPRAERDVPVAVEAEGWVVLEVGKAGNEVRILIER
jgi:TusA-related sulfurtransferase